MRHTLMFFWSGLSLSMAMSFYFELSFSLVCTSVCKHYFSPASLLFMCKNMEKKQGNHMLCDIGLFSSKLPLVRFSNWSWMMTHPFSKTPYKDDFSLLYSSLFKLVQHIVIISSSPIKSHLKPSRLSFVIDLSDCLLPVSSPRKHFSVEIPLKSHLLSSPPYHTTPIGPWCLTCIWFPSSCV